MNTEILHQGNPEGQGVRVLVDNLAVTLPLTQLDPILSILGKEGWESLPYGRRGYLHGITREGIQVHYAGEPTRNKAGEETLHLIIHGSGCRYLEAQGIIHPEGSEGFRKWEDFISHLLTLGGSVRRIDLAIDDFTGELLPRMVAAVEAGAFTTRFKAARGFVSYDRTKNGPGLMEGLIFGDRASQAYIRAYDKAQEQRSKGRPFEGECTRLEVEFKSHKAQAIAKRIAAEGSLAFLPGVIKGLIDFKEPKADVNRARWHTVHWWDSFLGHCSKVRLAVNPIYRTIQQVETWIRKQVAPSLALLYTHFEGDWSRMEEILNLGRARWKKRHLDLLAPQPT